MKVKNTSIKRFSRNSFESTEDLLAIEEPLEIRLGFGPDNNRKQMSLAVTMRTPGDDENLALGFLYSEGIIVSIQEILSVKPCVDKKTGELTENIIRVELSPTVLIDKQKLSRNFYATSSCGICGKASIEQVEVNCKLEIPKETITITVNQLLKLPNSIESSQSVFKHTGGIHATAVFNDGLELDYLTEDIGRHNAFDKAVGNSLKHNGLTNKILLLSGRAGFELIQKAAMAGCSIVCAIGAPSSLAVETAEKFNITLVGFLKNDRFNIYSHPHRIVD